MKKKHRTGHRHRKKKPKDDCDLPKNQDKPHCVFRRLPRYYNSTSPSRHNGPMSPLGYTQFFLPEVDSDKEEAPQWKVEYSTFHPSALVPDPSFRTTQSLPIPMHLLPGYEPSMMSVLLRGKNPDWLSHEEIDQRDSFILGLEKIAPWKLKDLTIKSWIKLARKLVAQKKSWKKFQEIM